MCIKQDKRRDNRGPGGRGAAAACRVRDRPVLRRAGGSRPQGGSKGHARRRQLPKGWGRREGRPGAETATEGTLRDALLKGPRGAAWQNRAYFATPGVPGRLLPGGECLLGLGHQGAQSGIIGSGVLEIGGGGAASECQQLALLGVNRNVAWCCEAAEVEGWPRRPPRGTWRLAAVQLPACARWRRVFRSTHER